jgi:hypothetical protein
MYIQIVQLGDVSLHLHHQEWHGERIKARGKAEELLDSYRVALPNLPVVPDVREVSLKAVLYGDGGRTASQLSHLLKGMLGRQIDIIGVEVVMNQVDIAWTGCACCHCPPAVLWLHTRGRITDINIESDDYHSYTVELDLEFNSYWKPLNPVLWHYERRDLAKPFKNRGIAPTLPLTQVLPYPALEDFFRHEQYMVWQKTVYSNTGWHYDPQYFVALHSFDDTVLPALRYTHDWRTGPVWNRVLIDRQRWSASPISVYVFKNLVGVPEISITIEHEDDIFQVSSDTVTVDMSIVNILMTDASYTLQNTDWIVLGDVEQQPGFVMRNGSILIPIASAVQRSGGAWAGQLQPGLNRIRIAGGQFAQHHIFRRL